MEPNALEFLIEAISARLNPENRFRFSVRSEDLSDRELAVISSSTANNCLCGNPACSEGWFTFRQNLNSASEGWIAIKECVPFWTLFDSLSFSKDEAVDELNQRLRQLEPDVLEKFQMIFDYLHSKAYLEDLWVVGRLIEGGLSDDGFHYFITGLIAQGQEVYESATDNPDNLADYIFSNEQGEWISNELIAYVVIHIYEEKTQSDEDIRSVTQGMEDTFLGKELLQQQRKPWEEWDFNDEATVKKRLPKTYAKFGAYIKELRTDVY